MFSLRTHWDLCANRLAGRLEALRAPALQSGRQPLLDLTESNPARCGLGWPPDSLTELLADPRAADYAPSPLGDLSARGSISAYLASRGAEVPPERILLTASTSEGYGFLMKLLCDPGDTWLVPAPSYPLLDLLAGLEAVKLSRYPLRYDGEWHIDRDALLGQVTPRTRAIVVVSPGNPTGAVVSTEERTFLERLCADRQLALVSDEVFADTTPAPSTASISGCLSFQLSGLSKVCGLPQIKAGWIAVNGPPERVDQAISRLETISDTYLSVSTPAQLALPALLERRAQFLDRLLSRLAENRATLRRAARGDAPWGVMQGSGGWSAIVQIGETSDEESICLALADAGVAVQPGFFYDFEKNGHLVVSLLPDPRVFREGVSRLARVLDAPFS